MGGIITLLFFVQSYTFLLRPIEGVGFGCLAADIFASSDLIHDLWARKLDTMVFFGVVCFQGYHLECSFSFTLTRRIAHHNLERTFRSSGSAVDLGGWRFLAGRTDAYSINICTVKHVDTSSFFMSLKSITGVQQVNSLVTIIREMASKCCLTELGFPE